MLIWVALNPLREREHVNLNVVDDSQSPCNSAQHQQPLKVTLRCYHDSAGLPKRSVRVVP